MIQTTLIYNTKPSTRQKPVISWIKPMYDKSAIKGESFNATRRERYRIPKTRKIDIQPISYNWSKRIHFLCPNPINFLFLIITILKKVGSTLEYLHLLLRSARRYQLKLWAREGLMWKMCRKDRMRIIWKSWRIWRNWR